MYIAEKGQGTYLNGEKIQVSNISLDKALMIYDTKLRVKKEPMLVALDKLVHEIFVIRMFGCATWDLTCIAKGQAEFNVDFTNKPWDLAAGGIIVEEAGGKVTALDGTLWNAYTQGYVASNRKVHSQVLDILNS